MLWSALRQFFKQAKKMGVHPLDFMEKKVMNPSIPGAGSSKDSWVWLGQSVLRKI